MRPEMPSTPCSGYTFPDWLRGSYQEHRTFGPNWVSENGARFWAINSVAIYNDWEAR